MKFVGITRRADGRIEIICKHGCGHPSKLLQETLSRPWEKYDGVHGCCGCCGNDDFHKCEAEYKERLEQPISNKCTCDLYQLMNGRGHDDNCPESSNE